MAINSPEAQRALEELQAAQEHGNFQRIMEADAKWRAAARAPQDAPLAAAGPGPAMPRPVMVEMNPEQRAKIAAERAFGVAGAEPPAQPAQPAPKPPVAAPLARQPDPAVAPPKAAPAPPPVAAPQQPVVAAKPAAPQQPKMAPLADRQAQREAALQEKFARDLITRYPHLLPPQYEAAITAAGKMPNGMEKLRDFAKMLRTQDLKNRSLTAKQRANDYNLSRDANNPNIAPGMRIRSLMSAVRNGDPVEIAAVHEMAGNPMGAARATNLAITDSAGDARVRAEEAAAQGNAPEAGPAQSVAGQLTEQMRAAMAIPEPDLRYRAVRKLIEQLNPNAPPAQIEAETQSALAAHLFKQNPSDPFVQAHLDTLRKDKPRYIDFARRHLNMTEEQAELMYNSAGANPQQRGRNAVARAGQWVGDTFDWLGGVAGGVHDALAPKPKE